MKMQRATRSYIFSLVLALELAEDEAELDTEDDTDVVPVLEPVMLWVEVAELVADSLLVVAAVEVAVLLAEAD